MIYIERSIIYKKIADNFWNNALTDIVSYIFMLEYTVIYREGNETIINALVVR